MRPAILILAILFCSCGPQWRQSAQKTIDVITKGAIAGQELMHPVIKSGCMVLAGRCSSEGRTSFEQCPELKKCIDALQALRLGVESVLTLAREASIAINLGRQQHAAEALSKAFDMLIRLRADYERIRAEVDRLIKG